MTQDERITYEGGRISPQDYEARYDPSTGVLRTRNQDGSSTARSIATEPSGVEDDPHSLGRYTSEAMARNARDHQNR